MNTQGTPWTEGAPDSPSRGAETLRVAFRIAAVALVLLGLAAPVWADVAPLPPEEQPSKTKPEKGGCALAPASSGHGTLALLGLGALLLGRRAGRRCRR